MRRVFDFVVLVWPLCGALAACGSDDVTDTDSDSGSSGTSSGSGGSAGHGGNPAGGRTSGTGGAVGGSDSGVPSSGGAISGNGVGASSGDAGAAPGGSDAGGRGGVGATVGQAGEGGTGDDVGDGLPGTSSFTRLTLRRFESSPTATGDCRDDFVSEWSFEPASRTLAWDYCDLSHAAEEKGSDTLSEAEAQAVLNALSLVKPYQHTLGCLADSGFAELELDVDGSATTYQTYYGCGPEPSDPSTIIGWPSALMSWLEWRSSSEIPAMPRTLRLFTGESPPATGSDCTDPPYPLEYELDLMTGEVTWSWCAIDPETGDHADPRPSDSRVLDAEVLESVRNAYAGLELGVSGPCDSLVIPPRAADGSVRAPRITTDEDVVLVDEGVSCADGGYDVGGWAIGVAALTHLVVDELAP